MKVKSLSLQNFKRFQNYSIDFTEPETGVAKDLIVLVGKNGSGKSTILQAIASMLGTATGRLELPSRLDWPGFDWDLADSAWPGSRNLELRVSFSDDEIKAINEYFDRTHLAQDSTSIWPGKNPEAVLKVDPRSGQVRARSHAEFYQFRGRDYARMIFKQAPERDNIFNRVGTVFWYTEHRTTNSLTPTKENGQEIRFDMDLLRRRLSDLIGFHERVQRGEWQLKPGQRDIYADMDRAFRAIFPNRSFYGPVPRTEIDEVLSEPWFYLYDGRRTYELGEMSGGERAIFPMILDFANWNIHNSVILIDEIELHLHPPLQQGFLRALPNLGESNQFIVTTHSDAVASITPEESLYRLE
jgi:predicted ATPase